MRRLPTIALLLSASALPAQSFNPSGRLAPAFTSYEIKTPFNEKISEMSIPFVFAVRPLPQLTVDVGTAFASATLERSTISGTTVTKSKSELSGLTDTQVRASYSFGQDVVVVTAGANLPTGSATVDPNQLEAATRIGSDFLTFPISGFGSGLGFTGGVAAAKPFGDWNVGVGASFRQSMEYEPFKDATGVATKYTPGPEIRARLGADRPHGAGRVSFGITYSKFGDDKANAATFNSGDRFIGQFSLSDRFSGGVDYSLAVWNLYRTSGTLITGDPSASGNITNALLSFGIRGPADVGIEPSVETRLWTETGSKTSAIGTVGLRFYITKGRASIVPGFGFSAGTMESATVTGMRASLGIRIGG